MWSQEFSIGLVFASLKFVFAFFGAAAGIFIFRGRLIHRKL